MNFQKLFVVFDPTRSNQPALERAAVIAAEVETEIHVFACIFSELNSQENAAAQIKTLISDQKSALETAVSPLQEQGFTVTTEVEWDKDWYQAAVRASIRNCADVVLKSTYPHSARQRILNRTSDWTLIRECLCPVLLVKEMAVPETPRILAAVDFQAKKSAYEKLNEQIIDFSQRVMEGPKAEVHFINAFDELKAVPDRSTLARNCGVSNDRVHIQIGKPEEVIVDHARSLEASLVVVGNSGRSGVSAMINGNTVERVLDKLDCDVLSIP